MMSARIVKLLFPKKFGHLIRYQNICHGFLQKKSCRTIQVACCMCVPLLRHVYPTWWLMEVSFLKLNLFGFQHVTLQNTAFPTLAKGKTSSSKVPLKNQGRFLFPKQSLFFAGLKTFLTLTRRKKPSGCLFLQHRGRSTYRGPRISWEVQRSHSFPPGILGSPKLRMVPWKLNTTRFGDWTP